jgi:hypothetical protein
MTDLPHFALPFRFANGHAVEVEQDTTDEIMMCCLAVILCPEGFRVELPEFGYPDPTFSQGVPDAQALEAVLANWEPRAQQLTQSRLDARDALVSYVTVRVGTPSED